MIRRSKKTFSFLIAAGLLALGTGRAAAQTAPGTVISNFARAVFEDGAAAALTALSDTVHTIVGEGYLFVQKTTKQAKVFVGDTIVYEIQVHNVDELDVHQVTLYDTLAQTLSFLSSTPAGSCSGGVVKWTFPVIRAGESETIDMKCVVVKGPYSGIIENIAGYSTQHGVSGTSSPAMSAMEPWPEASLKKYVDPKEVYIGDTLSYDLVVENTGPMNLTRVEVEDYLPRGLRLISASAPVDTGRGRMTWEIGPLPSGQEVELDYLMLVTPEADRDWLRNTAVLSSHEGAADTARASVRFLGHGALLNLVKSVSDTVLTAGDTLSYRLVVSNPGVRSLSDLVIADTLSSHLEYIEASRGASVTDQVVRWDLGVFEPLRMDTLSLTARIRIPVDDATVIRNTAWGFSGEGLVDSSEVNVTVTSSPLLNLRKHSRKTVTPGDTLTYALICSNSGTAVSYESVLTDTLPSMLKFIESDKDCSFDSLANVVVWNTGTLVPGVSDTLNLTVRVSDSIRIGMTILNTAWLGDSRQSTHVESSCQTEVNVGPGTSLLYAYKKVDKERALIGDTLTYTIYYGLHFNVQSDTIRIVDTLPREVRWIEEMHLDKPNVHFRFYDPVSNEIAFDVTQVSRSAKDSVSLRVVVLEDIEPGVMEIENQARVFCLQDTVYTQDDERTRARTLLVQDFLSVEKRVNRKIVEKGDLLTYTIRVKNESEDSRLCPVEITDMLPRGFRYRSGTTVWDSARAPDPRLSASGEGSVMRWTFMDTLRGGETRLLRYRIVVGMDARFGENTNVVVARGWTDLGGTIRSEEATASVTVRTGFLDERGFIFGKVFIDKNGNRIHDEDEPGLKNIELILEDGTRVRTDGFGKFSIPNVKAGQHVLRLNTRTLPEGLQPVAGSHRNMGDARSVIIWLIPGGMAKANFIVTEGSE